MTDASKLIDQRIASLPDWRGKLLSRIRALVKEADPEVVEEWKWMGTPVWNRDGIICTGETYKNVVKMTFAKGAAVPDPKRLFNSSLEGNKRRAIDFHEGAKIDEQALKTLIRDAIALNLQKPAARKPSAKSSVTGKLPSAKKAKPAASKKARTARPAAKKKATANKK